MLKVPCSINRSYERGLQILVLGRHWKWRRYPEKPHQCRETRIECGYQLVGTCRLNLFAQVPRQFLQGRRTLIHGQALLIQRGTPARRVCFGIEQLSKILSSAEGMWPFSRMTDFVRANIQ